MKSLITANWVHVDQFCTFNTAANSRYNAASGRRGGQGNWLQAKTRRAGNDRERWLKSQQLELFDIIKVKDKDRKLDSIETPRNSNQKKLKEIAVADNHQLPAWRLAPDGRFISYRLVRNSPER